MQRRQLIAAAIAAPLAMAQNGQRSLRERVLGAWRLISWEEADSATGKITFPCGKNAIGTILYDASGRMSAQIMNPDRPAPSSPYAVNTNLGWVDKLTREEALHLLSGYVSYFGQYEIDEAKQTVTHRVKGDIRPDVAGKDRVRRVEFLSPDRIVLKYQNGANENRLVWERERP